MYIVLYRFIPNVYNYVENHQKQQIFDGHCSKNPNRRNIKHHPVGPP
jgi:hypothetical protein